MRALFIPVFIAFVPTAAAQSGFADLDRDGDGYLSRLETAAAPEIARRFARFDIDRDRRLSAWEYAAARDEESRRAERDAALTARVKEALVSANGLHARAISVETYEGRVQLSGFVPVPDMASRAGRVVAGVSGVRTVHNDIAVK
jgi:hypothetical protein